MNNGEWSRARKEKDWKIRDKEVYEKDKWVDLWKCTGSMKLITSREHLLWERD